MRSKKVISILILIITIIGFSNVSNAALESKAGQSSWSTHINNEFTGIREMEKSGGTLGQNANIDGTTYLDSSKNGIDVHLALSTEWGGAAILAVSDYGAFNTKGNVVDKGTKVAATTGNITGVFQMADGNRDFVSGVFKNSSNSSVSKINSADSRYRNEYTTDSSQYHKGDALYQTAGWYSGGILYVSSSAPVVSRVDGLFGFQAVDGTWASGGWWCGYSRAVVVCGENL